MKIAELKRRLSDGAYDSAFGKLYGEPAVLSQRERYLEAVACFEELYPKRDEVSVFSAPGRSEVGGNHTDHQHGCVLAAAVNLDVIAIVAFHEEGVIRLKSKGHSADLVELNDLSVRSAENGTSSAIIRGVASRFGEMGAKIGGFDAYTTSDVLSGSGLSSSAAFEVLLGTIIDKRYNEGRAGAVEIAKIGQYAENVYFGKKSGLMDQTVSSVGGFVFIDFADPNSPEIKKISCDFEKAGYLLCITDTKGSHADLIDDYSSVPLEMNSVAAYFGKSCLREVAEEEFTAALPELRKSCSDRAVLRAAHFFGENKTARDEAEALSQNDLEGFLKLVKRSGNSSAKWLQNLYSCGAPSEQGVTLALWASERILGGEGAARVHGGGFAGTIQAFVPNDLGERYYGEMNRLFGEGSCHILRIRPCGGVLLEELV